MMLQSFFTEDDRCASTSDTDGILTMAFVNMQPFDKVYSPADAFCAGTLFPALDKPLLVGGYKK